ncbi:MAG TPA: hypothetical protein VK837_03450 [Longimicrobiales bacterium]|nr:hypothetical protein [Longimicrobiales bacterium]
MGYQLNRMGKYLPLRPADLGGGFVGFAMAPVVAVIHGFCTIAAPLFHRLEMRAKYTRRGYPKNYVAILRRREDA